MNDNQVIIVIKNVLFCFIDSAKMRPRRGSILSGCVRLLSLLWRNTIDWMAQTTGISFSQFCGLEFRKKVPACRRLPPPWVLSWPLLRVSLETEVMGLGPHDHSWPQSPPKGPISKRHHTGRWGLNTWTFGGAVLVSAHPLRCSWLGCPGLHCLREP